MTRRPAAPQVRRIFHTWCVGFVLMSLYGPVVAAVGQQGQKSGSRGPDETVARRDLHVIGEKISKAVLNKDIPVLLGFDRPDLRSADEIALQDHKSELFCFIFDSTCITKREWRSVYDKLSQFHELGIHVSLGKSGYDGRLYGGLLFYDSSSISDKDLRSADFLCDESPKNIAFWNFRLEDGAWKSVTPLFGYETDGLCRE